MTAAQTAHRATCSMVMSTAWAAKRAEPARTFSDCLRGAWAFAKRSAVAAAKFMARAARSGGRLRMRDVLRPIDIRGALDAGKTTKATMAGSQQYLRGT